MAESRRAAFLDRLRYVASRVGELALTLVVLVGLLWAADAVSRIAAETLLTRNLRDAVGAEADPQVSVSGRFFLPQVIRGSYNQVQVAVPGIRSGPLRIDRVDASLTDVRVPFHDVVLRDIRAIGIGQADAVAVLRFDDLNAYFDTTGRNLTVAPTPDGQITLSGSLAVLNATVSVRARTEVDVADGRLVLTPSQVDTTPSLNAAGRALLGQRLRLSVPLGTLPFGQQITTVTVGADAITVTSVGRAVVINP